MLAKRLNRIVIGGIVLMVLGIPLAMLLNPPQAVSTTELMLRLPAYNKYRCAVCHMSEAPTVGASDLNVFGADFFANDTIWDKTLALLNSDNDKCMNGFELGDEDGDGAFDDPGEAVERGNPGDGADCSIALTVKTWGIIKDMFRNEIPDYLDDEDIFYDGDDWSDHFP